MLTGGEEEVIANTSHSCNKTFICFCVGSQSGKYEHKIIKEVNFSLYNNRVDRVDNLSNQSCDDIEFV